MSAAIALTAAKAAGAKAQASRAEEAAEAALLRLLRWHDEYLPEHDADEVGRLVSAYGEACRRAGEAGAGRRG